MKRPHSKSQQKRVINLAQIVVRCVQSSGWLRLLGAGSDVPVTGSSGSVVDAVSAWTRFIELPAAILGSCVMSLMFVAQAWSFGGEDLNR